EGTRSRRHEMGEFKPGAMRCAIKAGVPIVPCVIDGSYKAWEEYHQIRPCEIKIKVLPPIETKGLEKERTKHIADEVEQMIRENLG
ncbi:MAG: 1-acyl-sn-glycerol-3-phosphate acyltransferase, partial [Firmicutes bacterium]|nr:1-acyl-sn-glycerol-3-phosphate acyltransferase [Bacillota bacterium]